MTIPRALLLCLTLAGLWTASPSAQLQLPPLPPPPPLPLLTFAPGDILVSLETGPAQWRLPDGTLRSMLMPTVPGTGEGMAFDPGGNLLVARWCLDGPCQTGNTIEKFNALGLSQGAVGAAFDCNPHAIVLDATGSIYVVQSGCSRTLLKFGPGFTMPTPFVVAWENQGPFWLDLGADGCTVFYTSVGPNVQRFDVCAGTQLPPFNAEPLPGGMTHDLRVLPDGGVIVSSGEFIVRLNATGSVVQTYQVPESTLWAGLELAETGTFWAANYYTSNLYKFDLGSGAILASFNSGTPANTVVAIRVKR